MLATTLLAASLAWGCGSSAGPASAPPHDVAVETEPGSGLRFVPDQITQSRPQLRLLFRNASSIAHNLTFETLEARTETIVNPGVQQVVDVAAPGPGTYVFVCTIHPTMRGSLIIS